MGSYEPYSEFLSMWYCWSIAFMLYLWLDLKFTVHTILHECLLGVSVLALAQKIKQSLEV